MNKEDLEKHLCEIADMILAHYDPCRITPDGCLDGKFECCTMSSHYGGVPCPHLKGKCTYQNIKCKTGFCQRAAHEMDKDCYDALVALEDIARIYLDIRRPYLKGMKE